MNHYDEFRQFRESGKERFGFAFPVVSLVVLAIKFALSRSWTDDEKVSVRESILKVFDEDFAPADLPIVSGSTEAAVDAILRQLLVALLDETLG